MTAETFKKAKIIEEQIQHLEELVEYLSIDEFKCSPPTRHTRYLIEGYELGNAKIFHEGEIVVIRKAFEDEINRLRREFETL